ncbi:MAG TPA: hypothetical protein VG369_06580 [Humibacter sp.]|nr:hypothetical protein [Humibacter sp.]
MTRSIDWSVVSAEHVRSAVHEYEQHGADAFFARFGFAPTTTYALVTAEGTFPPKAILGAAYEIATGQRLASADFEGGKSGAVRVLNALGFDVEPRHG